MTISILIADDHPVIRDGIRAGITSKAPDIIIVGEASNGKELLEMAKVVKCDVFIIDITMPELNGLDTLKHLKNIIDSPKAIMLSIHSTKEYVEKSLLEGAKGYVLKDEATSGLASAIRIIYNGGFYLSPSVANFIIEDFVSQTSQKIEIQELSKREREILQLISEGFSNKEIASKLFISLHTVNTHRRNIMSKLDIHKNADLIRYAIKSGISSI